MKYKQSVIKILRIKVEHILIDLIDQIKGCIPVSLNSTQYTYGILASPYAQSVDPPDAT